ncbi:KDP operon transcriptional regulatory protein KdpE [Ascidiaceihabitans donghaensis]|uniref:KDP operon transcriptional regulatory protein KdpE n=1 Tax=Ascidiaceihabitans donghaensis TaxID=1510460 RepID=A0A2R8BHV6_9RHOB|nr:response regulator [Ascidiaceihabitans donghaensis]SPH22683.1 KDP operon transcriptional regulatory protein KdpE [Ascidiaceihabitans donghaensis]
MDTTDPFAPNYPTPTANRPLLGLTVLVIEDSRFACEAMRLLCLRSGARIRRADSLRAARRHLQVYRPTIAIIDLGLPDGNGVDLIKDLAEASPRPEVVLGTSGDDFGEAAALGAGADGFLAKPITSLAGFQETILACLPAERQPSGPRAVSKEEITPDPIAFHDDMAHVADVLEEHNDERTLDYVAQFLSGVARSAQDPRLEQAAVALAKKRAQGQSASSETAVLAGLVQERLMHRMAI